MKPVANPNSALLIFGAFAASVLTLLPLSSQAGTLLSQASDANVFGPVYTDGGGSITSTNSELQSGRDNNGVYSSTVLVFQLPSLGAVANPFTSASFSIGVDYSGSVDAYNYGLNRDLYGLGARSSGTVLGSDYYHGGLDTTDSTLLQGGFITGGNTPRFSGGFRQSTDAGGGTNLADYLNAQYADGAGAGEFVFLRLSINLDNSNLDTIYFAPGDNDSNQPSIDFTTAGVPEPATYFAGFGCVAAGLLTWRRRRSAAAVGSSAECNRQAGTV